MLTNVAGSSSCPDAAAFPAPNPKVGAAFPTSVGAWSTQASQIRLLPSGRRQLDGSRIALRPLSALCHSV